MLKHRIITAAILIPLFLALLFFATPPAFCIITGLVCLAAAWEWAGLSGFQTPVGRTLYLLAMASVFMIVVFSPIPLILLIAFVWWLVALVMILVFPHGENRLKKAVFARALMGMFVLPPCWAAINQMRNEPGGIYVLTFLFVLIWGADTAAYFAGKYFGKRRLLPAVSPGKTWEGLTGAIVFTFLLTLAAVWFGGTPKPFWSWIFGLCMMTMFASVLGDLFESLMKRVAGTKDSGTLLPGHGGLLDRIDSLTAAAPVFALGAFLLGQWVS